MVAAYLEIIVLSISLAIDACIVAFSYGLCSKPWKINNGLRIAITTSFFQWLMPIIGWYMLWIANEGFSDYAAGVMIFSQNTPLYMSASLIGAITFVCVIIAYLASKTLSQIPTKMLETGAGLVLIALGIKVLVEHTLA